MEKVYKSSGLKGGYARWLKEFRSCNKNIEFYGSKDIKEFQKSMLKSIRAYAK